MPAALEALSKPVIIGRSSSHFTRVTRIFAAELRIDYSLRVVRDLMSSEPGDYKMRQSLVNMLAWLEENAKSVLAALPPERDLGFLEVTLFCLVTHLEFRDVLPTA